MTDVPLLFSVRLPHDVRRASVTFLPLVSDNRPAAAQLEAELQRLVVERVEAVLAARLAAEKSLVASLDARLRNAQDRLEAERQDNDSLRARLVGLESVEHGLREEVARLREQLAGANERIAKSLAAYARGEAPPGYAEKNQPCSTAVALALRDVLLAADASWEENDQGHDWRLACDAARQALRDSARAQGAPTVELPLDQSDPEVAVVEPLDALRERQFADGCPREAGATKQRAVWLDSPAAPGWWWWRRAPGGKATPLEVYHDGGCLRTVGHHDCSSTAVDFVGGQWCGPLEGTPG